MEDNLNVGIPGIGDDGQGDTAPADGTGQDFIETDPTGENKDSEESISIDDYIAELGFENEDELRNISKSYKEAQRKITEQGQRLAELEKKLGQQGAKPDVPPINMAGVASGGEVDPDEILGELLNDPKGFLDKLIDERQKERQQSESQLSELQEEVISGVLEGDYFKDMPPEEIRLIADEMENNPYIKSVLNNITPELFKEFPRDIVQENLKNLLETARLAALGRNAKSQIEKKTTEMKRSLKRKVGATTVRPTAGGQKTFKGNGSSAANEADAILERMTASGNWKNRD